MTPSGAPAPLPTTRLRIGISSCFFHAEEERAVFPGKTLLFVEQSMVAWVQSGGALAYAVPTAAALTEPGGMSALTAADYVADLDGLVLHGGADVCPATYGEEPLRPEWGGDERRDRYEIDLVHRFLGASKPVLGICRGAQILNVALGGTLYQDLAAQGATPRVHREQEAYDRVRHDVDLVEGSGLASCYPGGATQTINSVHHQGIRDVGRGLAVEARAADDGVVEAVRLVDPVAAGPYPPAAWALGVQWHPEFMFTLGDGDLLDNRPILDEFLGRAARRWAAGQLAGG